MRKTQIPDLFADGPPLTSSSDESNPALRHNIDTESDFNSFAEESNSRHSAKTSPKEFHSQRLGTSSQEVDNHD